MTADVKEQTRPKKLADEEGISFGRYLQGPERFGERLVYGGERNMLLFGPNGSGKGTRFLMPNLLQMRNCSVVVVDPKGELAAVTAPYRRRLHGDDSVVIINPFGVLTELPGYEDLRSAGYNPLRALDPRSSEFNSDAAWLTDGLIPIEGHDPHWSRSARKLVSGLIMYARLLYGQCGHLGHVRRWLTEQTKEPRKPNPKKEGDAGAPGEGIPQTAHEMMRLKPETGISAEVYAALRMRAAQFTRWDSREVDTSSRRRTRRPRLSTMPRSPKT